jgi:AcrR family transcriptional regulator
LKAATEIFADVGFAGARVDEIARRARVNKATIYYRIGDKKGLYARVLHDVFSNTAVRIAQNIETAKDPEGKLKTYIRNLARTVKQYPYVPPIMMRELASGARNIPEIVAGDFFRIMGMLEKILKEGEKKGVFIKANPLIIHTMAIGSIIAMKNLTAIKEKESALPALPGNVDLFDSGDFVGQIERLILRAVKKKGA